MSKLVNLSDGAYAALKQRKRVGESFSDVVNRLLARQKKKGLLEFLGAWPGPADELADIKSIIDKDRRRFKTREVDF